MLSRSTWVHLRIPFSYFLLPVFIFAFGFARTFETADLVVSFLVIHFLLYPASNAYNSYFDKDEKSIGGIENPPPVQKELYFTALVLDAVAIVLGGLLINPTFGIMLLVYGVVSKMYSHPLIRIKKYAVGAWIITGLFQGFFSFMMCYIGIVDGSIRDVMAPEILIAAAMTSVMLWGNYPMTQVYQHEEDAKHGDKTMSMLLGIRGTFIFVQIVFSVAAAGFFLFFSRYFSITYSIAFLIALLPVVVYFLYWFYKVWKDPRQADFRHTMRLNFISASCLNIFFCFFSLSNHAWP